MNSISISELSAAWLAAKADEDAAKARRYEIEAEIAAALPGKDEGSTSQEGDTYRVVVTRKLTRKVDAEALKSAWNSLQPTVQKAFNWKPDISLSVLRKLDEQETAQAARYITTSPSKPSIKVELITD